MEENQKYFTLGKEEIEKSLETSERGLSREIAQKRLTELGKNELTEGKKKSLISRFFAQLADVMIIVLLVAAVVSAVIAIVERKYADLFDSFIILLIVIINAVIGLAQESKAEAALEALKKMNKPFAKVLRDGIVDRISGTDIVKGDIVLLEAGDVVPADIRLTESFSLKIEEAALTGESVPSEKNTLLIENITAPLGDRHNMAFSGGLVAYGRGKGIVVSTGMNTEVGKIAKMLSEEKTEKTPLQKELAKTAKMLSIIVLAIAAIIFIVSLIRKVPFSNAFMQAVAIAVAAIPEGLPAVVAIVLALGVQKMSKKNAIVRHLPAVETLGCCEVICSDKTGTLTLNKMTVKKLFTLSGGEVLAEDGLKTDEDTAILYKAMLFCNDTTHGEKDVLVGDPTETALVKFLIDYGYDTEGMLKANERIDEKPFDSVRKLMTTVNRGEKDIAYIKGAPDMLVARCKYVARGGKILPMTDSEMTFIKKANADMALKALRVLAYAVNYDDTKAETDMIFVGLTGMIDPPRAEVKDAVAVAKKAGIKTIMITGDHKDTASAIAREIGILNDGDRVMTGVEIDETPDEEFRKIILTCSVFARVSPENKVKIVKALKSLNKIVAMTGDGVNDAPSIKSADIGIGMGITGTEVSKGASSMVLADDNFATIVSAVEEGRKVYANIKKAVQFLLSANIAEVLCLFITSVFLGVPFLTPVMILWCNLVTDSFPALALGIEKAEVDIMSRKPRKNGSSLFAGKTGKDILIQGAMQTGLVMCTYFVGTALFQTTPLGDSADMLYNANAIAITMSFVSLCFIQLFHSYNMRKQNASLFSSNPFENKWINLSFILGTIMLVAVVAIPGINKAFGAVSLNAVQWLIAVGIAFAVIPFVEVQKLIENALEKCKENKKPTIL